jgi:uncharacterized membrane protein
MKNILAVILVLSLFSCEKENNIKPNQAFSIENQSKKSFTFDARKMSLEVLSIEDSRCPENVQCVRAGEAIVTFNFTIGDTHITNQILCNKCEPPLVHPQEIKIGDYTIKLLDVTPYPNTNNTVKSNSAVFEIR